MKEIKLTQGKVTLVDDEDYDYLNQWKWCATRTTSKGYCSHTYYVQREARVAKNTTKTIIMHRLIMNTPDDMEVDHIDHNGLNNQKSNLRNCTGKENQRNRICHGKVGFKGVFYDRKYIRAAIKINKKSIHLGMFKTIEDAARAYDEAAKKYYGEFAYLNFKI